MLRSNAFMFALVNMAAFQDNFVQIKSILSRNSGDVRRCVFLWQPLHYLVIGELKVLVCKVSYFPENYIYIYILIDR